MQNHLSNQPFVPSDDPLQRSFEFADPETIPSRPGGDHTPDRRLAMQHYAAEVQLPGGHRYRLDLHLCPASRMVLSYRLTPAPLA